MAQPALKPSEAAQLASVITDPEKYAQLTVHQVGEIQSQLTEFQNTRLARIQSLQEEGLNEAQARKILREEDAALESGAAEMGGKMKRYGPMGTGQSYTMARTINAGAEGAWQAVEGLGALANDVGVLLNIQSPEDAQQYKDTVRDMRFNRKVNDIQTFGRVNPKFVEIIGQSAPWFTTAGVGAAGGLFRYGLSQMMVGGMASAASVSDDPLTERKMEIAAGMGLGGTFGWVFGVPSAAKAKTAAMMVKKLNMETSAANVELEEAVNQMIQKGEFGLTLSQVTGDRTVAGLETRAAGAAQKTRQNENIQSLFNHILDKSKKLLDEGRTADDIALEMRVTLQEANRSIHSRASREFGERLAIIDEKYGDDLVMSYEGGREYLGKLDDMMAARADVLNPGGEVSHAFTRYRNGIDQIVNPAQPLQRVIKGPDGNNRIVYDIQNRRTGEVTQIGTSLAKAREQAMMLNEQTLGGMTAGEVRRVQEGLNNLLSGKTAVIDSPDPNSNKHIAKALMGNFLEQLETNPRNAEAVTELKGLSDFYKTEMLRINKMEELVVNRVLGLKLMPADADKALDQIVNSGGTSLANTRRFLEEWNPPLLDELQGVVLNRILIRAGDATNPAVDAPIAIDKFANALTGEGPNATIIGQVGRGLLDDATHQDLVLTGKALRSLKNMYFKGIVPGGSTVDDLAINVVSRSPEFMARFLTRALTTGKGMDQVLTDPTTRQALRTIAAKGPTSRAGNAAMLWLSNVIYQGDQLKAEEERQEQTQNAFNRTSNALQ